MLPEPDRRRAPPQPNLDEQAIRTVAWISECERIEDLRDSLTREFPTLSIPHINYYIATIVIENNLGSDWYHAHVASSNRRNSSNAFLRSAPNTPMERRDHFLRVRELGRRLFELGQEDFIELLIGNLKQRDLEGALFEADVIRMLVSLPVVVALRETSGVKGDDYDIDLWLTPDTPLAIEAKTRAETGSYSDKRLTKTLENARTQLPRDGLGAVFVKVPTPWLDDAEYEQRHSEVVEDFLRKTTRVQFIVLVWDDWKPGSEGNRWRCDVGRKIFRSPLITGLPKFWIDGYEKIWGMGIDVIAPNAPF